MGLKSSLIRPLAILTTRKLNRDLGSASVKQHHTFKSLIRKGQKTSFGKDHDFDQILTHQDYCEHVPIRGYEELRPYFERIKQGESNVLWPGKPRFLAKTSGTTSGVKYIPITKDSIPNHIGSARRALFNYFTQTGNGRFFDGKMIFLSGSPTLDKTGAIPTGRLSGIVNHLIPSWIRTNQLPSETVNRIEDWEEKVDQIVNETVHEDLRLISGIPPWVQMYYEKLLEASGKSKLIEVFTKYSLFVYGGVNYAPYASKLKSMVGEDIDTLETYPASEGFIAFQDRWPYEGLRLNVNSGIFFEFVPLASIHDEHPERLTVSEVETNTDYVVIINSNAGLWGYNIGDTVRFLSVDPPRIIVSGRVKHFISAFGEHVIGKEIDQAMATACKNIAASVVEFCVAPQIAPQSGESPFHEWFVEFAEVPKDMNLFIQEIENSMTDQNIYYKDLIDGKVLQPLKITQIEKNGFRKYMLTKGKLGGQNKVARLMNDRSVADALTSYCKPEL